MFFGLYGLQEKFYLSEQNTFKIMIMKTNYLSFKALAATLLISAAGWSQTTLVSWNFNGTSATTIGGGELSPTPSGGSGSAQLVGGTTATFASGNSSTGTTETETTTPPNFGWNTTNYPAAGTENKQRGVQFNVSTSGYADIIFRFEQRLSNTAANTYVVQYTTDRTAATPVWVDAQTFSVTPAATGTGDTWHNNRTVDLSAVEELDNNPNVAFRVVSAFDPGAGDYLAARSTSTYAGGTVRFDQVAVQAATTLSTPGFEAADRFTMSPNPSRGQIVYLNQAHDIEVYDITGKLVLKAKDTTAVDARALSPGVYVVKTGAGFARKLVVE